MKLIARLLFHLCLVLLVLWLMGPRPRPYQCEHEQPKPVFQPHRQRDDTHPQVTATLSSTFYLVGAPNSRTLTLPDRPHALPYDLADLINRTNKEDDSFDFRQIWTRLGVVDRSNGDFDVVTPSYSRWGAQVFRSDNSNGNLLAVVFISADGGAIRRYLVFKRAKAGWTMSGNIDVMDGGYGGSLRQKYHRFITSGRNTWLALRSLTDSGTGVYEVNETWYDLNGSHPRNVLERPVIGYYADDFEGICNRVFGSKIVGEAISRSGFTVHVAFWVTYDPEGRLFREAYDERETVSASAGRLHTVKHAIYTWNSTEGRFVLNESASGLRQAEIEDVFSARFLCGLDFLVYNLSELAAIKAHGSARERSWLSTVLGETGTGRR